MFARLRKTLGNAVRKVLYWIGWVITIVVLGAAIILAVTSGHALVPLLLGGIAVVVWLMASGLKAEGS